jgi:hypothetical protein
MLESEVTSLEVTWFKASLLAMVYAILLSFAFLGIARLLNHLGLAMAILIASIPGTFFAAFTRPRRELKLWLILASVSLALTIAIVLAFAASDI